MHQRKLHTRDIIFFHNQFVENQSTAVHSMFAKRCRNVCTCVAAVKLNRDVNAFISLDISYTQC